MFISKKIQVGDSLIQNLFNSRIWETSFCLMHCLNFGISVSFFSTMTIFTTMIVSSFYDDRIHYPVFTKMMPKMNDDRIQFLQRWPCYPGRPDWERALAFAEWGAGQPLPQGDHFFLLLWDVKTFPRGDHCFCLFSLGCENLPPEVIVVSAGQSNQGDSAEEIAEGLKEICAVIRSKQPQAFLVLLVSSLTFSDWNGYISISAGSIFFATDITSTRPASKSTPGAKRKGLFCSLRDSVAGGRPSSWMKWMFWWNWCFQVNLLLGELAKGNSRLQLVNIDTGFVQVATFLLLFRCQLFIIVIHPTLVPQVDQSISHHDMWDYLELTQKGYSKAFEPVNELLTQVSTFIGKLNIEEGKLEDTGGVNFHWETQWGVRSEAKSGIERKKQFAKNHPRSCFSTNPTFAAYIRDGRRALQTGGRRLRGLKFFPFFPAIARNTKVSAARTGAWQPEQQVLPAR